jgi:hypothetical protein
VRLCPSSSKPGAPWAAHPVSPALDTGLLGHSAAVWGNRAFLFGGLQEFNGSSSGGGADGATAREWAQCASFACVGPAGLQLLMLCHHQHHHPDTHPTCSLAHPSRTHTPCTAGTAAKRTVNILRAYALDEAGTQGGLLPVLSDVPQLGEVPSCRMYHRCVCAGCEVAVFCLGARVCPAGACTMYV